MLTEKDILQIRERGSSLTIVESQIENFKNGFPFLKITKAATTKNGIKNLTPEKIDELIRYYEKQEEKLLSFKFVPASGAASRMFQLLFSTLTDLKNEKEKTLSNIYSSRNGIQSISTFFRRIKEFAFHDDLNDSLKVGGSSIEESIEKQDIAPILEALLLENGLNYGSLPKGLLKFHKYGATERTPVEEHLVEGANYCKGLHDCVRIHFTVSPEHKERFIDHINQVKNKYEERYGVRYEIDFSEQKPSTDTIAVGFDNEPFREVDEKLLFRPGGHGALIENLNDIDADIIFIKNIDNVVPDHLKNETFRYKKVLAGLLLKTQKKIFKYLEKLEKRKYDEDELEKMLNFAHKELCIRNMPKFKDNDDIANWLQTKFDRPIRVCGMVKNEGEPGGGPFFAINPDNSESLQIVEGSQIDPNDENQQNIAKNAAYFNPVDLVCAVKNWKGGKFDLRQFVDKNTGFISEKSKDGKVLKAQELPGLWNGAMSNWNTIFIEVPISTFNPVKTINDLLREQHLS